MSITRKPWYKRLWFLARTFGSQPEVAPVLDRVSYGADLHGLSRPAAAADRDQAEAAAVLLKSVESVPNAVFQLGSMLVIKCAGPNDKPIVLVRKLTIEQMMEINRSEEAAEAFMANALRVARFAALAPNEALPTPASSGPAISE